MRIPTLPQPCQTLGGALEQRAAWASSGHGKKWFLIHFQVLSSGFKSRRLDAATSHKCLQARQQPEPHHVPPTLLLAVLVLRMWLPKTLRGGRQRREHARSCMPEGGHAFPITQMTHQCPQAAALYQPRAGCHPCMCSALALTGGTGRATVRDNLEPTLAWSCCWENSRRTRRTAGGVSPQGFGVWEELLVPGKHWTLLHLPWGGRERPLDQCRDSESGRQRGQWP